ncbi:MAG: hypothetical protein AB8G77_16205 [Rhodothermales bacterium]
MIRSAILFHTGLYKMGPLVWTWLALLVTLNAFIPLYFLPRIEAIATIIVFMIGFILMILLTHFYGFTRILGLGHILWIPLVIYLLFQINSNDLLAPFNLWIFAVILCNGISLVIDTSDVVRYVNGDKEPLVSGL